MSTRIEITVNGEPKVVREGLSIEALLVALGLPRERIAVERNRKVVRRSDWAAETVRAGDRFEIVHFVGGG